MITLSILLSNFPSSDDTGILPTEVVTQTLANYYLSQISFSLSYSNLQSPLHNRHSSLIPGIITFQFSPFLCCIFNLPIVTIWEFPFQATKYWQFSVNLANVFLSLSVSGSLPNLLIVVQMKAQLFCLHFFQWTPRRRRLSLPINFFLLLPSLSHSFFFSFQQSQTVQWPHNSKRIKFIINELIKF